MKSIILPFMFLCLVSCGSTPAKVIVKDNYIVRKIPDQLLVIPDQVPPLDLTNATQKSLSAWLIRSEERTMDLETKLKEIKKIQDTH